MRNAFAAPGVNIQRSDLAVGQLQQVRGLAAGRGAGVEHPGAGGQAAAELLTARDDCGAPTLQLQLAQMALLYAHLGAGSQADLEATYGAQFAYFRALKARYDPHNQLINDFYERVLGPVAAPGAARAAGQAGRPPA